MMDEWKVVKRNGRYRVIDHNGDELYASEYSGQANRIANSHNATCDGIQPEPTAMEVHIQQAKDENQTVRVLYKGYDNHAVGKIKADDLFDEGHIFFDQKVSFGVLHLDADIREITTLVDKPTPLGEQVWEWEGPHPEKGYAIMDQKRNSVCWAETEAMRDIILGIPALVKAAKPVLNIFDEHSAHGGNFTHAYQECMESMRDALKAMGV